MANYCSECGAQVTGSGKFCAECGSAVMAHTGTDGGASVEIPGGSAKCPRCGSSELEPRVPRVTAAGIGFVLGWVFVLLGTLLLVKLNSFVAGREADLTDIGRTQYGYVLMFGWAAVLLGGATVLTTGLAHAVQGRKPVTVCLSCGSRSGRLTLAQAAPYVVATIVAVGAMWVPLSWVVRGSALASASEAALVDSPLTPIHAILAAIALGAMSAICILALFGIEVPRVAVFLAVGGLFVTGALGAVRAIQSDVAGFLFDPRVVTTVVVTGACLSLAFVSSLSVRRVLAGLVLASIVVLTVLQAAPVGFHVFLVAG